MTVFDTSRSAPRSAVPTRVTRRSVAARWAPADAGIVVGVSRGDDPTGVLTWAAREARVLHAPLVICHAGKGEQADAVLSKAGALARRAMPAGHVETVGREGRAVSVLAETADEAGLVVVGTAEGAGSGANLFGTAAVRLAAESRCTAVVARPPIVVGQGPYRGHVVVGVDGSPPSRAALGYAFAHAAGHRRPLVAVHVTPGSPDDYWADDSLIDTSVTGDPAVASLLAELTNTVRPFNERYRGVRVTHVVHRGRPLAVLSRLSRGAALLAVGMHGRPTATRSRLGSTARGVLLDPPTTVAAVRSVAS